MKLKNLRLLNFKNHLDSHWEFNNRINCFVGDNGSGKTNILDAIHYLSLTKSYFNSNDSTNINFDSEFFTIKGSFEKKDNFSNIVCNVKEGSSKSLKNQIAGYITRFIKKEIRLESKKEESIENQEQPEEDTEIATTDNISADAELPMETVESEPTAK